MANENEPSDRAQEAIALASRLSRLLPFVRDDGIHVLISNVLSSVVGLNEEVESHFRDASRAVDAEGMVAVMLSGALAEIMESHVDGDIRSALFRAGREVGKYACAQWASGLRAAADDQRKKTQS